MILKQKKARRNNAKGSCDAKDKPQQTHGIPTDLNREGVTEITTALRQLLADTFALYLKTKNFHWHSISAMTTCYSTNRQNRSLT
jgi:hypothetical protein